MNNKKQILVIDAEKLHAETKNIFLELEEYEVVSECDCFVGDIGKSTFLTNAE